MRHRIILLVLIFTFTYSVAQVISSKYLNQSYKAGEKLTYVIRYGFITGGYASLTVKDSIFEGVPVYHAVGRGYTVGMVDKLFAVNDIFESFIDKKDGMTRKKIRKIKEGNYKYYNEATFDRSKNTVNSLKTGIKKVPEGIHDIISVFYYLRCMDLSKKKNGDEIPTVTYFSDDIFPFKLRYRGKELLKTKQGYLNCHKFVPVVEPGRIFKKEDDMTVWMSDDKNMIPVKVSFEMWVGAFVIELTAFENTKSPLRFIK